METVNGPVPHARTDKLLVQELADETLVYDLQRYRACCLNRTAALIWRHCDGQTTVADLTRLLQNESQMPVQETVVWYALERLEREHLLQERLTWPAGRARYSRRELMRKAGRFGLAGGLSLLLPAVVGVVAAEAQGTVSCISTTSCAACQPPNCCGPGRICCGGAGTCQQRVTGHTVSCVCK